MDNQNSRNRTGSTLWQPHPLTIEIDENLSTLVISMRPDYSFDVIWFLLLLLFGLPIFFMSSQSDDRFIWGFSIIVILGAILYSAYNKRLLQCVIRKNSENIRYVRGGVFGSRFSETEFNFMISNIVRFEMQRYVRKWWDKFQIFVIINTGERLDLSGRNLDFSECQASVEKIRNFINPKLTITAVD